MFQVLIAEDSKPILRNIRMLLEESGLPLAVAAGVSNGEEGLEIIRRQPVDILITDIRMPKMDGLTLIEHGKKLSSRLKTVLISGYNDFEYTRKAINLQVNDYLLKPVERNQLVEVMEAVIAQLQQERQSVCSVLDGIVRDGTVPFLPEPAFYDQPKLPGVIRLNPFGLEAAECELAVIKDSLAEVFGEQPVWLLPARNRREYLFIVNASVTAGRHSVPDRLRRLQSRLLAHEGLPVSVLFSSTAVDPCGLSPVYHDLSRRIREQLPLFKSAALEASRLPVSGREQVKQQMERSGEGYALMIENMQRERFLVQMTAELKRWEKSDLTAGDLEGLVHRLAAAFDGAALRHCGGRNWNVNEDFAGLLIWPEYEVFCNRLLALSGRCFDELLSGLKKSGNQLFEKIDEHLRSNLYAQVTMSELTDKFHVSSSYICRVIKRYSQNTFVSYYLELKIREARRLMEAHPEMKIREISDALSFHDQHYFSKVFKEYAGISPSEYRAARGKPLPLGNPNAAEADG